MGITPYSNAISAENNTNAVPSETIPEISSVDYSPSVEEKKTLKLVDRLFNKAKKKRSRYDTRWADYYKIFRGKQWPQQRPSYRHSEVINLVFSSIQAIIPILTDTKPRFEFLPEEPTDRELAEILNEVAAADWAKYNWLNVLTEVLYDGHIFSTGLSNLEFDAKAEQGLGAIVYRSKDPFYAYPDPNCTDINVDSDYFIWAEPTDIEIIKRKYERGKFVKPDVQNFIDLDRSDISEYRFKSPTDNVIYSEGENPGNTQDSDKALVITLWLKDNEEIEEKVVETDPNTGESVEKYIQRKKYPKGRKIVVANNVVLADEENPNDDGFIPSQKLVNYLLPREFWGISEIEQLESPQKIFNKLVSFTLDVLTLMGNPVWILDSTAGVEQENLVNKPGLVVVKEPGGEVRREPGVQLQPYVLQLIDRMKVYFDDISGASDITKGIKPESVTSGIAIQNLQDAAQTRIRQKSRNMDTYLQTLGQHYLSMVFQFYTIPRVIRVTNNQNTEKYFKFHIEYRDNPETGETQRVARIRPFVQNEQGQFFPGDEKELLASGKFDVRVSTGSALPFSRLEKESKYIKLYELQAIDQEELLKALDYPNWEGVLARMKSQGMGTGAPVGPEGAVPGQVA